MMVLCDSVEAVKTCMSLCFEGKMNEYGRTAGILRRLHLRSDHIFEVLGPFIFFINVERAKDLT